MQHSQHQNLVGFIWNIANKLRGPHRPPQYRRVMLPLMVLRRFDWVLAENKHRVLDEQSTFVNLASSKKLKIEATYRVEIAAGRESQAAIKAALHDVVSNSLYRNPAVFETLLCDALQNVDIELGAPFKKAFLAVLSECDPKADLCLDAKGNPEPDPELRDAEIVSLPNDISLPLPLKYYNETGHEQLLTLVKDHCENYLNTEVLPHVPDVWIAHDKTKVGYEISDSVGKIFNNPEITVAEDNVERLSGHKLKLGDIVISRRGEMGWAGLVREYNIGWLCRTGSIRARLNPCTLNPEFLLYQFSMKDVAEYLSLLSVGSTMDNLNASIFGRLSVVVPPSLISHLQLICETIDAHSIKVRQATSALKRIPLRLRHQCCHRQNRRKRMV